MAEFESSSGYWEGPYGDASIDLVIQDLDEDHEDDPGAFILVNDTERVPLYINTSNSTSYPGELALKVISGSGITIWKDETGPEQWRDRIIPTRLANGVRTRLSWSMWDSRRRNGLTQVMEKALIRAFKNTKMIWWLVLPQ